MKTPARISLVYTFFLLLILSCVPTQSQKVVLLPVKVIEIAKSILQVEPGIVFGGLPKAEHYPNKIKILNKGSFIIGYDEIRECPAWVAYKVTPDDDYVSPKRPSHFEVDFDTVVKVKPSDYTRSGYDRGHLAPNYAIGSRYGNLAQLETFKMSNIAPQKPGLNRGYWKDLEMLEAEKGGYGDKLNTIWVFCGCIWDNDKTYVAGKIEIPDAFFKIIIDLENGKPRVMAFVMPQVPMKKNLSSYLKSVDEIEALTHFDFMSDLQDIIENEIELLPAKEIW